MSRTKLIRVRKGETVQAFIRRIAAAEGITDDDLVLDYLLWEKTGYPAFFRQRKGETVTGCLSRQFRAALRRYYANR